MKISDFFERQQKESKRQMSIIVGYISVMHTFKIKCETTEKTVKYNDRAKGEGKRGGTIRCWFAKY